MTSIELCFEQLAGVREAAGDPRSAYVIRSRIERLLLSCARVASTNAGISPPNKPGHLSTRVTESFADVRALAAACDVVYDVSHSLCQPSESFDSRWEDGWRRLSPALDGLETALKGVT